MFAVSIKGVLVTSLGEVVLLMSEREEGEPPYARKRCIHGDLSPSS